MPSSWQTLGLSHTIRALLLKETIRAKPRICKCYHNTKDSCETSDDKCLQQVTTIDDALDIDGCRRQWLLMTLCVIAALAISHQSMPTGARQGGCSLFVYPQLQNNAVDLIYSVLCDKRSSISTVTCHGTANGRPRLVFVRLFSESCGSVSIVAIPDITRVDQGVPLCFVEFYLLDGSNAQTNVRVLAGVIE